jgi:hypothetical protein
MRTKIISVIALTMFAAGSGCGRGQQAPPDSPEIPDVDVEPGAVADDGGRIRITLTADGKVVRVEGRESPPSNAPAGSPVGDWQGDLSQLDMDPKSAGEQLAVIQIFGMKGDDTSEIKGPGGEDLHAHAGGSNPSNPPHCHDWIYIGPKRYLVHC